MVGSGTCVSRTYMFAVSPTFADRSTQTEEAIVVRSCVVGIQVIRAVVVVAKDAESGQSALSTLRVC